MRQHIARFAALLAAALFIGLAALPAAAQKLAIDIYGPGQRKANMVITPPLGRDGGMTPAISGTLNERIDSNLSLLPFLGMVPPSSILGGGQVAGPTAKEIDFKKFNLAKVDLVLTEAWGQSDVELRVYEAYSGSLVIGRGYSDVGTDNVKQVADRFCDELMRALTGHGGFFSSRIAFDRRSGETRDIWSCSPTGEDLIRLTDVKAKAMSPSWSPDGRSVVFSVLTPKGHQIGVAGVDGGKPVLRSVQGNSVISPSFMPDGRIVATLNVTGDPDIYVLNRDFKPEKPLAKSWSIDVSPSFSLAGDKMAFASGRAGNPHIFLLDVATDAVTRVTYEGKYNTSPALSPDGRLVAFSRQFPDGHRIFVHDLMTGAEQQVTYGPGDDEQPSFSPDGYFLAFSSSRSGEYRVYFTTRHGDEPVMVNTGPGEAKSPDWSWSTAE